jgi:Family of unknown function (DUF6345)
MKWKAFATLGLTIIIAACTSTPAPTTEKPVIQVFKASPDTSQKPGTVTLSWEVSGAAKLEIDGGVGTVTGDKNSKEVSVSSTTSFTLTATNDKGAAAKSAIVEINVPEKLPILTVGDKPSGPSLTKLSEALGLPDAKPDSNGKIVFTGPDFQKLPIIDAGGGPNGEGGVGEATKILNFDFDAIKKIQVLPGPTALEKVRSALSLAGINATNGSPVVDYSRFKAIDKTKTVKVEELKIDTHIDFNFSFNNYELVGPGAKLKTAFAPDGKATQLVVALRGILSGESRPIISQAKANLLALETIKSDALIRKAELGTIKLGDPKVVYFAPDLDITPDALFPHYRYNPTLLVGQETVPLRTLLIPATIDAPKATLTLPAPNADNFIAEASLKISGGKAPFKIEWTSSTVGAISTQGNDTVVSYRLLFENQRSQEARPNNKETLQATITDANGLVVKVAQTVDAPLPGTLGKNNLKPQQAGRYDVGTEWINACGGLGASASNAQGFVNRMGQFGIPTQFNFGENNAWERDFKRNGLGNGQANQYVDDVDMVFYTGHANGNGWVFCDSTHDNTFIDFNETQYGKRELEWLIIAACGPLQLTEGGVSWNDRWGNTFHGLHLIMGYATTSYDGSGEGRDMANGAMAGLDLRSAWVNTAVANQPSSVTWSIMGVYGPGGQTSYNDHFWGKGSVSADMGFDAGDGKGTLFDGWWLIWGPS